MTDRLRAAFEASCAGYSPDRVVVDPNLNKVFLLKCGELGIVGSPATLNRTLLNLRKRGGLRGLKSAKTSFANEDQYRFAAEMAGRFLERRDGISLDDILCDPELAREFDELAARVAPGFSAVEYRWAALNLRKSRRFSPELLSRVVRSEDIRVFRAADLRIQDIPSQQGLYLWFTTDCALYAGEAESLHNRIRKHLDHSDNKGLARWLWEQGADALHLEIHALPALTDTRVRRALETELIRSRKPLFNVKR